jgi:TetR/AcrR family transcriptional repressor of nem operon
MTARIQQPELPVTKRKLLDAGVRLMRAKGFNGTSVDDICVAAGVTKGGFFHYFNSKEAPFRKLPDPLDRVFGRLDFAKESMCDRGRLTKGCLIGVLAQELSFTHPELRGLFEKAFSQLADDVEGDLAEAKSTHRPDAEFNPRDLAMLYISILQGSMMLAKASDSNAILLANIEQFRRCLESLFRKPRRAA